MGLYLFIDEHTQKFYQKTKFKIKKQKFKTETKLKMSIAQIAESTSSITAHAPYPITAVGHIPNDGPPRITQRPSVMTF
jgi:hypothetical protein